MNDQDENRWAYASLLAGGLLILVGGFSAAFMLGGYGGMGDGMMGGYSSYMATNWYAGMGWWMGLIGTLTGGMVLYAATRLRTAPEEATAAGTIGIVGGVLSLLAMGGWIVGAALAILGGALALGQGTRRGSARSDRSFDKPPGGHS